MKPIRACLWRDAFYVLCSLWSMIKSSHVSGVCWKQFMMLLEEVLVGGVVLFHAPCASPQLLAAMKSARRLAISAARCPATRFLSSGVTLVSPLGCRTQGLPSLNGGSVTSLRHPARSYARGVPFGEVRWDFEVGQMALKRPAAGHFLAAGDAGLWYPRAHQAFGETILVHPGHVPCPEQCATREVVLEREDPGVSSGVSRKRCGRRASVAW